MSTYQMNLACLVEGEDTDCIFEIPAQSISTVEELRGLIRNKLDPQANEIAEKDLTIWRVSIPITKDDKALTCLNNIAEEDKKRLLPMDILSSSLILPKELHEELPKDSIHILVQLRLCNIYCFLFIFWLSMMISTNRLH